MCGFDPRCWGSVNECARVVVYVVWTGKMWYSMWILVDVCVFSVCVQ